MASRRGLPQLGTLGAGNHYAEIQVPGDGDGIGGVDHQPISSRIYDIFVDSAGSSMLSYVIICYQACGSLMHPDFFSLMHPDFFSLMHPDIFYSF